MNISVQKVSHVSYCRFENKKGLNVLLGKKGVAAVT